MPIELRNVARAVPVAWFGLFAQAADAGIVRVVEFERIWSGAGYFLTPLPAEIGILDDSFYVDPPGRQRHRSGVQFNAYDGPGPGLAPVCRFYKTTPEPLGAHFYSAFAAECEIVASDPAWTYEGVAFHAALPDAGGGCPAGTGAMYRVFDGRSHRLTYSRVVRQLAVEDGAVAEGAGAVGVAFCVPLVADVGSARLTEFARGAWTFELVSGVDPWPESASFAATPLQSVGDDANYPPLLGTTLYAWGTGNIKSAARPAIETTALATWQPYTGEILVRMGVEVLLRLDYRGGDVAAGCWQRIWNTFDDPWFFWSAPCVPVTARRS